MTIAEGSGAEGLARRQAIALLGGSTVAAMAAAPARGARPAAGIDLSTPAGQARAYRMMRGALDDRLVIGCVTGRYYGVVESALTPLFGVTAATFARYRPTADGGQDAVTIEYAYFTDPATGRAIDRFTNPYTGDTVEVPIVKSAPALVHIAPDLHMTLGRPLPGLSFDHRVMPVEVRGDDVWFTEVTRTSAAIPGAAKPFHYSECITLHARRADLAAPGAMRVRCDTGFTNVVGWRPWLKMGDRPGHMMAIGAGCYGITPADLPPAWLEATRIHHPDLLADPAAPLDSLWTSDDALAMAATRRLRADPDRPFGGDEHHHPARVPLPHRQSRHFGRRGRADVRAGEGL